MGIISGVRGRDDFFGAIPLVTETTVMVFRLTSPLISANLPSSALTLTSVVHRARSFGGILFRPRVPPAIIGLYPNHYASCLVERTSPAPPRVWRYTMDSNQVMKEGCLQ